MLGTDPDARQEELVAAMAIPDIDRAQAGLIDDMDRVADALYGRTAAQG